MKNIQRHTYRFEKGVFIIGGSAVVGPKEGKTPLGSEFDKVCPALRGTEHTWEDSEIRMQKEAVALLLEKIGKKESDLDLLCGGDLIDQLTVTNFAAKEKDIPFLGLYNACATMAEGLLLSSALIHGGFIGDAVVVASSHNATSERQYRNPTELGAKRPPSSQWTVSGAGAMALSDKKESVGIRIVAGTVGRVIDYGCKDPGDMGAAMAPAAADTIEKHLNGRSITEFDLICTGDLGKRGHELLCALLEKDGIMTDERFQDSGIWMYSCENDVCCGASGAGCSASLWSSYLIHCLEQGKYRRVLLVGTGALLSAVSVGQGRTIPAVAHAVEIVKEE